jgi:hypothetical protein
MSISWKEQLTSGANFVRSITLEPTQPMPNGVLIVDPLKTADWDQQLARFPAAGFFHSAAWARVLHDSYGYNPVYFVRKEADRLASILPVMEINSWLTGRRGVSLPFTDDCEVLGVDQASMGELFQNAVAHAKKRNWKYLEFRGARELLGDGPAWESYFNHQLPLETDVDSVFAKLDGATRRAVRKAKKQQLTVEFFQTPEAMRVFYDLFCKTRRRHGAPPQPFAFFESIQRHVMDQNQGWIVLARQGNHAVAGAIFFHFGKSAIYKYGASDEAFQHLRANNLVMWEAIQRYAHDGFTVLDFGRTSLTNEGLRRFKLNWGTRERKIDYVSFNVRKGSFSQRPQRSSALLNPLYKLTPLFVMRLIGILFYKHIALLSFSFDWGQLGNCV